MAHDEAAVGIIKNSNYIIFIRRKDRKGDPWSGDIAFPGGFIKEGESPEEAVLREIREEISVTLSMENIERELPVQRPVSANIKVHPFILHTSNIEDMKPGDEVAEIREIEINQLKENYDPVRGRTFEFRGWIIWGLTARILTEYMAIKD